MKFKKIFEESTKYKSQYTKHELALEIVEGANELSEAVKHGADYNEKSKQEIKSKISDLILTTITLYLRYDEDVETLKPLIGRKLREP